MLLVVFSLVPLLFGIGLAAGAHRLSRWLTPAAATRVLSAAALVSALSTGAVLALLSFVLTARFGEVAEFGGWSGTAVDHGDPVPDTVGPLLGLVVVGLLLSGIRRAVLEARSLASAHRTCRALGEGVGGLVVVDTPDPDAYALAGFPGRVVVSTGMLRALEPAERRVLLAHERAHLRHRHHLYVQVVDLAAAANPMLRSAARAVRFAIERWADEDAARAVDRSTAARSLARAGLAVLSAREVATPCEPVLAAAGTHVPERVQALLAGPPRHHPLAALVAALLVLTTGGSAVMAGHATENRFEHAIKVNARHA